MPDLRTFQRRSRVNPRSVSAAHHFASLVLRCARDTSPYLSAYTLRGDDGTESGAARNARTAPCRTVGRCGTLLPLFRLVGVPCIAALWRVESLPRHRGDRPKLNSKLMGPVRSRSRAAEWLPGPDSNQRPTG